MAWLIEYGGCANKESDRKKWVYNIIYTAKTTTTATNTDDDGVRFQSKPAMTAAATADDGNDGHYEREHRSPPSAYDDGERRRL